VRHKLNMQSIELVEDLAAGAPPVVCDAGQIQQVILILLVNAAEALGKDGRIAIQTKIAGGTVEIRVRDNGPGIPDEVMPKIFEPFFTTKEEQQRTGLGLAVARSIVEQHGGEIEVQSKKGAGTEFLVSLPVGQAELVPGGAQ
jgi:two-component system, NtrC family, sensor kinase